jgi:hypothetical protein
MVSRSFHAATRRKESVSNIISADHDAATEDVVMSNGMTSVFVSVLLLSGSDLARSDWEVATVARRARRT